MKGIILSGGAETRLNSLPLFTNTGGQVPLKVS